MDGDDLRVWPVGCVRWLVNAALRTFTVKEGQGGVTRQEDKAATAQHNRLSGSDGKCPRDMIAEGITEVFRCRIDISAACSGARVQSSRQSFRFGSHAPCKLMLTGSIKRSKESKA